MEHTSARHLTVYSVATRRHASEQQAVDKAMSAINEKVAAYKVISPNTDILDISAKSSFLPSSGYTAIVSVTVGDVPAVPNA